MRHVSGNRATPVARLGGWARTALRRQPGRLPCIHVENAPGGGHQVLYVDLQDGPCVLATGHGPTLEDAKSDLVRQIEPVKRTARERLLHLVDIRVTCADDRALRQEFATH
ncbi:MAG: hypothetical protein M3R48_03380 [Candidatus Dormibacteraeota bacterium]|nr:hypothetical protein [Candidatus Dormibacteraeota bacterium]